MSHSVRFGIIGAGGIAQAYAMQFEKIENAHVVGVADINPEAAKAMAERLHCTPFGSIESLADQVKPDAVIVCTPPSTHAQISNYFAQKKIHILCEKPLSVDSDTARTMFETASKENVILTMASKFRYVADVIRAKSILTSGILGEIVLFENAFTGHTDMSSRWNSNPSVSGGGVLIDNGTHSIDIMRYLFGPLAEVQAAAGKSLQGLAVEETARVLVKSAGGVLGTIDLSWSIDKQLDSFLNIYGSNGTISVGWKESKYRESNKRDWVVFGSGYDKGQAFNGILQNFIGAITRNDTLLISPEDAIASVRAIEACYAALRSNQWTPIQSDHRKSKNSNRLEILEAKGNA